MGRPMPRSATSDSVATRSDNLTGAPTDRATPASWPRPVTLVRIGAPGRRWSPAPPQRKRGLPMRRRTTGRRTAAVVAVGAALFTVSAAVVAAVDDFPRGLLVLLCGLVAAAGSWEGVLRRGRARAAAIGIAVLALAGGVWSLADEGFLRTLLLVGLGA